MPADEATLEARTVRGLHVAGVLDEAVNMGLDILGQAVELFVRQPGIFKVRDEFSVSC